MESGLAADLLGPLQTPTAISDLPHELVLSIAAYLDTRSALNLAATNHRHHDVLTDHIWTRHIRTEAVNDRPLWSACNLLGHTQERYAVAAASHALRLGADPGACIVTYDDEIETPLLLAVKHQSVAMVQLLMDYGADPCASSSQHTAVTLAAAQGALEVLECLLSPPVETTQGDRSRVSSWPRVPNSRTSTGQAPLHLAASVGADACVRLLIEHGARIDIRDKEGGTPLHEAIRGARLTTVQMLLNEYRADALAIDMFRDNALDIASRQLDDCFYYYQAKDELDMYLDILRCVLAKHSVSSLCDVEPGHRSRLHLALPTIRAHRLLAPLGADIRSVVAVEALIDAGINVNAQADDPRVGSALWSLASNVGRSRMHPPVARKPDRIRVAELLLDAGADIESCDSKYGQTPLLRAAERGHVDYLALLLSRGADAGVRDFKGRTVLQLAAGADHFSGQMTQLLLDHQMQPDGSLSAVMAAQLDAEDEDGCTPLLASLRKAGHRPEALLLLQRGAKAEFLGTQGTTPMIAAIQRSTDLDEIGDALIEMGASVETRNSSGATPLMVAALTPGVLGSVPWLVRKGARLNVVDTVSYVDGDGQKVERDTPLAEIVRRGLVDTAKMLLRAGALVSVALECDPTLLESCRQRNDKSMLDLLEGRTRIDDEGKEADAGWLLEESDQGDSNA